MNRIDRPVPKLLFGVPEFVPGDVVQSTVRLGTKWREDLKGLVHPRIACFDLEGNEIGTATIIGTLFGSFKDIGYLSSCVEHDEAARDYDGLFDVMGNVYPGFKETDQVTTLFFKYVPKGGAVVEAVEVVGSEGGEGVEAESKEAAAA